MIHDWMKMAKELKGLSKTLKALEDLGAKLEMIGSLDQAAREATDAKDRAYAERDKAAKDLKVQTDKLKEAEIGVLAAKKKAENIVATAEQEASARLSRAEQGAAHVLLKLKAEVERLEARKLELGAMISGLTSDREAKHLELVTLEDKIDEVKKRAAALFK
jgi:hypothetical protein